MRIKTLYFAIALLLPLSVVFAHSHSTPFLKEGMLSKQSTNPPFVDNGNTQSVQCSTPDSVATFGPNNDWWPPFNTNDFVAGLVSNDNLDVFTEVCAGPGSDTLYIGGFDFDPVNFDNNYINLQITKRKNGSPVTDDYLAATYNGEIISENLADTANEWTDTDSTTNYILDKSVLIVDIDLNVLTDNDFGFLFRTGPAEFCMNAFINSVSLCVEENTNSSTLVADAGPDQILNCEEVSVTLGSDLTTAGPTITYQWSSDIGGLIIDSVSQYLTVSEPGFYFLKVTDSSDGEMAIDSIVIIRNVIEPTISIAVVDILTCANPFVFLDASIFSPSEYIVEWTDSDFNFISSEEDITVTEAGEYILKVTDPINGCYTSLSILVAEDVDLPFINIATPPFLKPSESLILDAMNSSVGAAVSYSWTTDNGNIVSDQFTLTPTIDSPGVYCLTIVDLNNGCEISSCVEVAISTPILVADAGPDQTLSCDMALVTLGSTNTTTGPTITYEWTSSNGVTINNPDSLFNITSAAGNYYLKVTDSSDGQMAFDTVLVSLDMNEIIITIVNPETLSCTVDSVLLDVTVPPSMDLAFEWTNSQGVLISTDEDIWVDTPGDYILMVTDLSNGCFYSVSANVTEVPAIQLEATLQNVSCFEANDGSISIVVSGGIPPYSYQTPFVGGTASGLASGLYTTTVIDGTGCSMAASFEIFEPDELVADITIIGADSMLVANPTGGIMPYTYDWNTGSTSSSVLVDLNINLFYAVTITDANGCATNKDFTFEPNAAFNVNSLPINVYPNPSSGLVTIEQSNISREMRSLEVYDLLGKTVSFKHVSSNSDTFTIDIDANATGAYILILDLDGILYHQKIILF